VKAHLFVFFKQNSKNKIKMKEFPSFMKPKNIAAGLSLMAAISAGEVPVYACEKNDKPITKQTSDFFNTETPKSSVPGICFVGGIKDKEGPAVINDNAAEIVETTNINKKESQKSEKLDQGGNISTILIGEKR
jgi:hypothetical protein